MPASIQSVPVSNKALWAGRIMSGLVVLFLTFDGAIKLVPLDIVVETSRQLGIPEHLARTLGVLTLADVSARVERAYATQLEGKVAAWFAGFRRRLRPSIRIGAGMMCAFAKLWARV